MVIKTFRDIVDRQKSIKKLEEMKRYIEKRIQELEQEKAPGPVVRAGREILKVEMAGKVTYQLERVKCGKPNCQKCPHGPYWYGYKRVGGKLKSFYVGKELPKETKNRENKT